MKACLFMQSEIERYAAAQSVHRRQRGVASYVTTLQRIATAATNGEISAESVADWFEGRADLSPNTILAEMCAVSSFCRWRRRRDPASPDLLSLVERPTKRRGDVIRAPASEVERTARWCESEDATPRTARYVALCLYAGLRREEARLLTWEEVDEGEMELRVLAMTAKLRKPRTIPIAVPLARMLGVVPRSARTGAVVGHPDGTPLSVGAIAHFFDRELARFGIHISPHMLRRAFATRLDDMGVSLRVIQELLGHSSLETTQRYVSIERRRMRAAIATLDGAFTGTRTDSADS